ncbi:MAG: hypothetical protein QNJ09_02355 [Paracoccaceae bacterium]|nr:hypothetical protein [Paracoccaceae bacterium]
MIPNSIRAIDSETDKDTMVSTVQDLSIAEIESISIEDISTLENNVLKDVVNDAVRTRLAQHLGGTYTSPPKLSVAEMNEAESAG